MRISRRQAVVAGIAMSGCVAKPERATASSIDGDWFGAINPGGQQLRLKLTFAGDHATLYSLDQGSTPIPSSSLHLRGSLVRIEFARLNASIEGEVSAGWIVGEFRQGNALPIGFSRLPIEYPSDLPLTREGLDLLRLRVGAPALAVAASYADGRNLVLASGIRMLGEPSPADLEDRWHIGSISKSMTAVLVGRLVDAGTVSWEQTIEAVLGGQVTNMRSEYRNVSIRQLLLHLGGLPKDLPESLARGFPAVETDARASRIKFVNLALNMEPLSSPGSAFGYSNSGYVVVGAMLEHICDAPWEQLMRQHVFLPLGMRSAGFGAPGVPGLVNEPVGHEDAGIRNQPLARPPGAGFADNAAVWGPAGTIHASLRDMLRYLGAHRDRDALLSSESWSTLLTPPEGRIVAMGWTKRGETYWHSGSNTLWYSEAMFDSVQGLASIAVANDGRIARVQRAVNAAMMAGARSVAM